MKKLLFSLIAATLPISAQDIQRFVAIDNVCAWPNLTLLPDGSINATIFGKPSHGQTEGAAECWNSANGQFWGRCQRQRNERQAIASPYSPLAYA